MCVFNFQSTIPGSHPASFPGTGFCEGPRSTGRTGRSDAGRGNYASLLDFINYENQSCRLYFPQSP